MRTQLTVGLLVSGCVSILFAWQWDERTTRPEEPMGDSEIDPPALVVRRELAAPPSLIDSELVTTPVEVGAEPTPSTPPQPIVIPDDGRRALLDAVAAVGANLDDPDLMAESGVVARMAVEHWIEHLPDIGRMVDAQHTSLPTESESLRHSLRRNMRSFRRATYSAMAENLDRIALAIRGGTGRVTVRRSTLALDSGIFAIWKTPGRSDHELTGEIGLNIQQGPWQTGVYFTLDTFDPETVDELRALWRVSMEALDGIHSEGRIRSR